MILLRRTLNDEYENFITAHYIPTKPRAKDRVPCEAIAIMEKWENTKNPYLIKETKQVPMHKKPKKPRER